MYATGAFKNPFADFDFSKIAGEFKFPMINVETIVEADAQELRRADHGQHHRRRVDEGDCPASGRHGPRRDGGFLQARQRRDERRHHRGEGRQADRFRQEELRGTAIANTKELTELYSKSHAEAFAALSHRVSELTEEVKAAIAKK